MYLPFNPSFVAPLHAAPNLHCEYVKFIFGHSDQPNNARMPSFVIGPLHDPPGGHERQPARFEFFLFGTQYSSPPQFAGLIPPRLTQLPSPWFGWFHPNGQAMHFLLGISSCG